MSLKRKTHKASNVVVDKQKRMKRNMIRCIYDNFIHNYVHKSVISNMQSTCTGTAILKK